LIAFIVSAYLWGPDIVQYKNMRQAQREINLLKEELMTDIRFSELIILSGSGSLGRDIIVEGSVPGKSSADYLKSLMKKRISPKFLVKYFLDIKPDFDGRPVPSEKEIRIGKTITEHFGLPFAVEVRGPMTIEEVEKKYIEKLSNSSRKDIPKLQLGFVNGRWDEFKDKYQDDSEIYYFISEKNSWRVLYGRAGYVLIESENIIDIIVTSAN
jgi:hypothetical protein